MSRRSLKVTFAALDTSRIPDALTKAALLLIDLNDRGVIAHMADRIKVRRQGGYCGLDLWLFLIVYFSSDTHHGVKTFWRTTLEIGRASCRERV